ncbi:centriolin-like [Acanthaster planci]|uniref:Centriolin-like n=1 Tax=Acanthaster planci TaxID=133434 RepID=A0A8B7YR42_ACAPL|nr:centriolin-like [Acanthaster planci]
MRKAGRPTPLSGTGSTPKTGKTQPVSKRKLPQPVARNPKPMKPAKDEDDRNDSGEKSLVRYINDVMIKKISGKDVVKDITTLNLTLTTKDDGKKIRYIENLEGLVNLQVLKISHNQISKIERLHHLTQLRELDISCNRIGKVEGLETLMHLQSLNLSHNLIETIPAWLGKKLSALRVFHIAGNLLYSLSDVFRLRPLKDLVHLSLADNPLCDLPHHRLFAVFHLRTLQVLDKQAVTETERQEADKRFEQEELENLEMQLGQEEKKLRSLQKDHSQTVTEQEQSKSLIASLKTRNVEHQRSIHQLQEELHAKDDLLKRKTAELNKACEKQYRLEQELAFHKIDAKFEPLAFRHDIEEADGGTEESPYIGKAGYKRNELARQQFLTPKGQSIRESRQQSGDAVDSTLSPETQGQLHAILQDRLTDKQRQIASAEERLSKLQDKIDDAEMTLQDKNREMERLSIEPTQRPLSAAERQELTRRLGQRLQAVKDLQQQVAKLEEAMGETLDIIQSKEREMERLRRQLPGQRHPQYAEAATEMANKEQEVSDAGEKYRDLQQELEEVVALLAQELEKVNQVKQQMAKEKVDLNDNLKDELEDTIAGLTDFMQEAQRKAAEQDRKNQALQRERDQLLEQLRQAERSKRAHGGGDFMPDDWEDMQRRLDGLEAALAAAEAEKEELKASLQAEHDNKMDQEEERLKAAEEEATRLKSALNRQKQQAQAEKDALKQQLHAQQRQAEAIRRSADQSHDPKEIEVLANQLQALQAERDDLEDRLHDQQAQMQDALDASLHPDDVVARINQLKRHLEHGRGKMKPLDEEDTLGRSLAEVEDTVRDRLTDTVGEREEARRRQKKAEQEAEALRRQVAALEEQLEDVENEHRRRGKDSPELAVEDLRGRRQRQDAREARASQEEAAMVEAMREEVRRLGEKLRQRPPHREQAQDALRARQDPHTLAELQQLEVALAETQRQMRENDQLAADELARAEAEMRHLKDDLHQEMMRARERERQAKMQMEHQRREADRQTQEALAEVESRARERARRAAQELARAEDEMARLHHTLADREKQLQQEMQRGDATSKTLADQRNEIGALYDTLEEQRAEILKLHDALNRFTMPQPGMTGGIPPTTNDSNLEHLLREIERLKHALQQQRSFMSAPGIGDRPVNGIPPAFVTQQQAGSRPSAYIYSPPMQPTAAAAHRLPSQAPPSLPNQPRPPPTSTQQTVPQQRSDLHSTSYQDGVAVHSGTSGQPRPNQGLRNGPGLPSAIPNPQGMGPQPPPLSYPKVTPHGTVRAAPGFPTNQPADQSRGIPQSSGQPVPAGMPSDGNVQPPVSMAYPVGSTQGQQAGYVDGRPRTVQFAVPPAVSQTIGTGQVQQQTSDMPESQGANVNVQGAPIATAGVAPPTGQPVMAQIPLATVVGAVPGGPTPGLILGTAVPAQQTTARNLGVDSEETAPPGEGTAEILTEGESKSAVPVPAGSSKRSRTIILPPGGLFCNVPEHHHMEDEIARLKKLLAECRKSKRKRTDPETDKFKSVLENRNKELETLELAIQRQRETLRALHNADIDIRRQRDAAARELQELNTNIDRKSRRRDFLEGQEPITPEEADYEMLEASIDQDYLEDEIACLGRTLAKRRAELRVADRLLQECQADLKDATDKARSTLEQYDEGAKKLKQAQEDAEEIEKRSVKVAKDLVQAQEHLDQMQHDVKDMEEERRSQEDKMRAVDDILNEKDSMFRSLEGKIEQATDRLQKVQAELLLVEEKATEQQDNARQQNQLIADKTAELQRLEEQVEEENQRLIELNREIGRKQADLKDLTSDLDTNSKELVIALRDAENELTSLKQKVKETRVILDDLNHQKHDLLTTIEDQRSTLAQQHLDAEKENRTLQDVQASINKSRADLKHTLEMIQLEKTELEALKMQHEAKMGDLEKTQLAALQEKAELETLQVSCQEKRAELERTSKQLSLQRSEKERLTTELSAMEARAVTLHREEEGLEEQCRQWDSKVAQLTRQHMDLLASRKTEEAKLEDILQDLTTGQEKLDRVNSKRELLTNQFQSYKQQVKETGKELRLAREELQKVQDENECLFYLELQATVTTCMYQELQEHEHQKSEARADLARLHSSVEKTQQTLLQLADEHKTKQEALQRLKRAVVERHQEVESGQHHVERVQADVEQEENRLSRLIGGLTVEAEHLRSDITTKRQELEEARRRLMEVQTQTEQQQQNRRTVNEQQAHITQLESDIKERLEEKTKLAEALNFSHTEMNSLRKDKESLEKRLSEIMSELDETRDRLHHAKQKFKDRQMEFEREVEEANMAASEHCSQADRLSLRLKDVTQQYIQLQSQSSRELEEERRAKAEALEKLRELSHREETASVDGTSDLDELEDLQRQKLDLTKHLVELQSNIQQARLDASLIRDGDFLHDMSSAEESRWRQDKEKAKMQEEQDRLKLQIRQRVSRQAEMLDSVKERTNSTLHSLKRKLDNLEGLVSSNSATARSMASTQSSVDGDNSLNELGVGNSDRYPQHDTSPIRITSGKHRPLKGILKTTQEIDQPPPTSVPSRTYSSQRHRRTSPSRPVQQKQRQTAGDSGRGRLEDFMNSIQRLKEEKLAQIEHSSYHS